MWPSLVPKVERYRELEKLLVDPDVATDRADGPLAKEQASLAKLVKPYLEYEELGKCIEQAAALVAAETDPEMRAYAEEEVATLKKRAADLKTRVEDLLLVDPGEDFDSLIVEIRAGTGGDEAALFAGDLYDMYTRYARDPGLEGRGHLLQPRRARRVQGSRLQRHRRRRVTSTCGTRAAATASSACPKTETQGRIHTSAATVAVLPEPDEVQVEINPAGHRVGADAGRRRGRPARQQDRERRPHLVQEGHARTRSK